MKFKYFEGMSDKQKEEFEKKLEQSSFAALEEDYVNKIIEFFGGVFEQSSKAKSEADLTAFKGELEKKSKADKEAADKEAAQAKDKADKEAADAKKLFEESLTKNAVKIKRFYNELDDAALKEKVLKISPTPEGVEFLAELGEKFGFDNGPQGGRFADKDKVVSHEQAVEASLEKQGIK
jgi:hypothetical protein